MSKRERIGVAVLIALVTLSVLAVWLLRKPADTSVPAPVPYYKQIQAQQDTADVPQPRQSATEKQHKAHKKNSSHKTKKAKKPKKERKSTKRKSPKSAPKENKPKPAPRSPLDEPC